MGGWGAAGVVRGARCVRHAVRWYMCADAFLSSSGDQADGGKALSFEFDNKSSKSCIYSSPRRSTTVFRPDDRVCVLYVKGSSPLLRESVTTATNRGYDTDAPLLLTPSVRTPRPA